ncbi:universal stress protein [Nocardia thailandica]|uniref:Universal stress protein n=1 Tax=Nocardia thailandica TaxID=257275 RepID=A0ABW6PRF7_9NOCA
MTTPTGHRPVLAAVDGSASSYQAVGWAAAEAVLHDRALHILTSAEPAPGPAPDPAETERRRADADRILGEAAWIARAAVPDRDLAITTEVCAEAAVPLLIARSADAAILVVGSRGRGAFQRSLLGSVSTAVTRHARCPVAVVQDFAALDPVTRTRPVLVGVDGTANSAPAVALAFEEAARREVGLIALHAFSDSSDLPALGWEIGRGSAEADLAQMLAGYGERYPRVPVRRVVVANRPVRSLYDESASAQLLVVGSHGRGGFASMMLGSTSTALLYTVDIPVIVVRERG